MGVKAFFGGHYLCRKGVTFYFALREMRKQRSDSQHKLAVIVLSSLHLLPDL